MHKFFLFNEFHFLFHKNYKWYDLWITNFIKFYPKIVKFCTNKTKIMNFTIEGLNFKSGYLCKVCYALNIENW
jgi:hypothetical protein